MFKRLLVPLDGSAQAAVALPLARAVARQTGAALRLLRVVPPTQADPEDRQRGEARANLARIAIELAAGGGEVDTAVRRSGHPGAEIVREAEHWPADLIVMATHGRSGLARALNGSVAQRVVSDSPVPVLLLRPGGHRVAHLTTLLVPVDGTPEGARALGAALPLAQETGARIVLLQVVVPFVQRYFDESLAVDPMWDEEALTSARGYVETLAGRLRQAGVSAQGRVSRGPISQEIVGAAGEVGADVIVMSTHALTGAARTLLGSIADEVVRTAPQPVLLVRQRTDAIGSRAATRSTVALGS
jgi:nucleotide-binding universal stress UspA family protein